MIDGAAIARGIRADVAQAATALAARGVRPGLAAVLVGDNPASAVYVRSKARACEQAGMKSVTVRLPAETSERELLERVDQLNADDTVHGILVQMPLPKHIDPDAVVRHVLPTKDVDGFHPVNVGKLLVGERDGFAPCTPAGVRELLMHAGVETEGADCVILGRSNIVGKPLGALMIQDRPGANATVTWCHSRTRDLASHARRADILVAAIGRPRFVAAEMVKPGAVVIDVGINRVAAPDAPRGYRIVGDVDFERVREVASRITPVPGGVGPMTIAMLLRNTVRAAELHERAMASAGSAAAGAGA